MSTFNKLINTTLNGATTDKMHNDSAEMIY
jgi:hypothetical protein